MTIKAIEKLALLKDQIEFSPDGSEIVLNNNGLAVIVDALIELNNRIYELEQANETE